MNIYIPAIKFDKVNRKRLFIMVRPFLSEQNWVDDAELKRHWELEVNFNYTQNPEEADILLLPEPVNNYTTEELSAINTLCETQSLKGYCYISGDLGKAFPHFEHLTYFRNGGFKRQLLKTNYAFPVILSDHFERIYQTSQIILRTKSQLPVIGFCGHATLGLKKRVKEYLIFLRENMKRFIKQPLRKDYEPLFASAYQRAVLLKTLEASNKLKCEFIYRNEYRAGAITPEAKTKTSLEYYENIKNADYVLCVRGTGNFSVRLYETLMMGRIPIFVDTDCLLPFEDHIDWKSHVVWVDWKDRHHIVDKVSYFHNALTDEDFKVLQLKNRKLWKETLSLNSMMHFIKAMSRTKSL